MVNLDWLAFSVLLVPSNTEKDNHSFTLNEPAGMHLVGFSGTNIYEKRSILYNSEWEKVLTLLWCPHSKIIKAESMLVEVANKWLYGDLGWVADVLGCVHQYTMQCVSRLDICYDFEMIPNREKIILGLAHNDLYVAGKREGSMFHFYDHTDKVHIMPKCMSWGSKNSNIKWKIYNKYLEISEFDNANRRICTKPYIENLWKVNGMEPSKVWRLEVSVTPAHKFEYHGERITFEKVIQRNYFEDMFISLYQNRFVIRKNQGHKDKTNDERVYLLGNFGEWDRVFMREPSNLKEIVEYVSVLRANMSQLDKVEVRDNERMRESLLRCVGDIVEIGHLKSYFYNTYGQTFEKYRASFDK